MSGTVVYLDICALERPFDDARSERVRREATALWLHELTPGVDERARLLTGLGFGPLDALHLAFAEQAQARWFVTTDDRLLRKALEQRGHMHVEVVRPDQLPTDAEEDGK